MPVHGVAHSGNRSSPEVSFGKKYVDFCGIVSPRSANSATCAIVGARTRNAESASLASTAAIAWSAYGV